MAGGAGALRDISRISWMRISFRRTVDDGSGHLAHRRLAR